MFFILYRWTVSHTDAKLQTFQWIRIPTSYLYASKPTCPGIGGIVHILGATSGGHVNPAVTWALFLDRRVSVVRFVLYTAAQFIGGFAGAGAELLFFFLPFFCPSVPFRFVTLPPGSFPYLPFRSMIRSLLFLSISMQV